MNQPHPEYDYDLTERSLPGVAAGERAEFLTKTYLHLLLAIVAFVAIEVGIFKLGYAEQSAQRIDAAYVDEHLAELAKDEDLSRYIL